MRSCHCFGIPSKIGSRQQRHAQVPVLPEGVYVVTGQASYYLSYFLGILLVLGFTCWGVWDAISARDDCFAIAFGTVNIALWGILGLWGFCFGYSQYGSWIYLLSIVMHGKLNFANRTELLIPAFITKQKITARRACEAP